MGSIPARVTTPNFPKDGETTKRYAVFDGSRKASGGNEMRGVCDDEVGVYDGEGPPVPIPNTEVKLVGGDNTCLATDREDSTMPTQMFLNSSVGRARGC